MIDFSVSEFKMKYTRLSSFLIEQIIQRRELDALGISC